MITPAYLQRMTRYDRWQNDSLYAAANELSSSERRADRGSFFKSIHATLSHIFWADQLWMSRLSDWENPGTGISDSAAQYDDWNDLSNLRRAADTRFIAWADTITQDEIEGALTYTNTSGGTNTRSRPVCLVQIFTHQTHHRGQVHAMLTAAGAKPQDTDVPFLPEEYL